MEAYNSETETAEDCSLYAKNGFFPSVAKSNAFFNATLSVIVLNAAYMGIEADYNHADMVSEADTFFQCCEYTFCVYFTLEILVRWLAFANKLKCYKDKWFVFDSFLVIVTLCEFLILPVAVDVGNIDVTRLPTGA